MLRSILAKFNRRHASPAVALCAILTMAQGAEAQVTRGFDRSVQASVSSTEFARQPDFWQMETQLKPVRLVWVDEVNPVTGEKTRQQIWYLAWRSIVRPVSAVNNAVDPPINVPEPLPGPLKFIPQATLVTYGDPATEVPAQILHDEILPAAMTQIRQIERDDYLDMVAVVQDLPAPVPADAEDQKWIYGAATWKGVNPDTRFFKVILGGFTNAYEVRGADGEEPTVWRKVIVEKYHRPGDRFDPNNAEFRYSGNPEWVLQPDTAIPAAQPAE